MLRFLSITNTLIILVFCAAFSLSADVTVTPVRPSGSSLDTSLRNEVDNAVRQATIWLGLQQHLDGSWGESNHVRLTSMALFALKTSSQTVFSESCARAALWLDGTATNRIDDLGTHAWRLLAITFMLPDNQAPTNLLRRLAEQAVAAETDAEAEAQIFWREALAAAGLAGPVQPAFVSNRLAQTAASWPPALISNASGWKLARLINRLGNGQLVRGNTPLDWRTDLAKRMINTQRRVPDGGGYWNARNLDGRIEETALGVLCLLEL